MSLWCQLKYGLRVLMNRRRADREIADEVEHYLEQASAAGEATGLSREQARRTARLELGSAAIVSEKVRSYGWENVVGTLSADLRYGARQLISNPGFALVSVVTLALGIGATTAIFSAVNPILFEPLPYPHSSRIAMIWYRGDDGGQSHQAFGNYRELAARSRLFDSMAVLKNWRPVWQPTAKTTVEVSSHPERLDGQMVSASYFRTLGVEPTLGRGFEERDDVLHGPKVVILSDGLWRRGFGGDVGIIGRQIALDDDRYTVAGVMPRGFENVLSPTVQIWSLLQYDAALKPQSREWGHHLSMLGRLRAGVGIDAARMELEGIALSPRSEFPRQTGSSMDNGLIVNSLRDDMTRGVRPALYAVLGAVMLVLLIASVNVTNLLLSRGSQRRGEFAMRVALGAGRSQLIRQVLTESVLLAVIGGGLGMVVAQAGVQALIALSPPGLPRVSAIVLNGEAFVFALGLSTLVGVVMGLVPAWQAGREAPRDEMVQSSRRITDGRSFTRGALIVAEVAIALVLLVSAGLLFRSMQRLLAVAPGFEAAHVLTMQVQTYGHRFQDDEVSNRFFARALEAARQVPGVAAAAFASELPLSGDIESSFDVYGVQVEPRGGGKRWAADAIRYGVTPEYFKAMGIPLRRGRLFESRDMLGATVRPVLISESFAKHAFPNEDPIGRRIHFGGATDRPWDVIAGVVGDVRQTSLAVSQPDAVYVTTAQWLWSDGAQWLVVKAHGDAAKLTSALQNAIWSVDRTQPIVRVATMDDLIAASAAERRFVLVLFEAFSMVAVTLAAIGLYGVLSGTVTERTREIGVRAALGARQGQIIALIVRQGMMLSGIGIAMGLGIAAITSRFLIALLFGTSQLDPMTYIGVTTLLVAVAAIACWIPARRAASIDPAITLRAE